MKNIYKALADFQQEVGAINKDSKGYNYKYASFDNIIETIKPLLKKHKLGYSQPIDGTQVKTILFHTESGETIESAADIPQGVELKGQNEFQVLGSAITYLRRYSLSSVLGLVTDEDNDAQGQQVPATVRIQGSPLRVPSDKQLKMIKDLATKEGHSEDVINARLEQIKTSEDASLAIAKLKGEL